MISLNVQDKSFAMPHIQRRKISFSADDYSSIAKAIKRTESAVGTSVYSDEELNDMYIHSLYKQLDDLDSKRSRFNADIKKAREDGAISILLDAN